MEKDNKQFIEEKLASERIFDGNILHIDRDEVRLPGGYMTMREVIRHIGAVGVIPMTDDRQIYVEKQYRYPHSAVITEIPAGKLDSKSEDRLDAAKRELREETGLSADEWISLGDMYPAAAYSDEVVTIYLARGLHKGEQQLDEGEFLDYYTVPLEKLIDEVMAGEIPDSKTQIAILKLARLLGI